jgi:hypothetical protein
MSSYTDIIDLDSFSNWIDLQTESSKKCLKSQLSEWKSDPQSLVSLSKRFKRFKIAIEKNTEFYSKSEEIFRKIADIEKRIQKLLGQSSDLEKESYGEILFLKSYLSPLNFIPCLLSIWSIIRVYILPGLTFLSPFIILLVPFILLNRFQIPLTISTYTSIVQCFFSGDVNGILNITPTQSSNINIISLFKQIGPIVIMLFQSIIQPYWTYKHLKSIDNIIVEQGQLILEFKTHYEELKKLLAENGFTFFKCPLPEMSSERDAAARVILESTYFKMALKYIGSLEVIIKLANKKEINPVKWIKYQGYPVCKLIDTFDYNVPQDKRQTINFNFNKSSHHSLLTGPNKGGKSTSLRALSVSTLLAHTYGCTISKTPIMTPFSKLFVCLKPDDLPGSKSRFEREVEFTANTLKYNEPIMICIDELYHSTNPPDALRSCDIYCNKLWNKSNVVSVISTHLFELVEKAPSNISRLCCPAFIDNSGNIHFSYKLEKGICKTSSVDELLKNNGLSV